MPTGRWKTLHRITPSLFLASVMGCGDPTPQVAKPVPPDMSALVRAYETPDAPLDPDTAGEVASQVDGVAQLLNSLGADEQLFAAIEAAAEAYLDRGGTSGAEAGATPMPPPRAEGGGYLRVTRICNGWAPDPVPDAAANGTIVATVGFSEIGPDPVAWGEFEACRYRIDTHLVLLAGADAGTSGLFRVYLGAGVTFSDLGKVPAIFALDAMATIDDVAEAVRVDFRIDPASTSVEVRLGTSKGNLVVIASGVTWLGARAANGHFNCDLPARTCTSDGGQSVTW